jgi:hypothetical protein
LVRFNFEDELPAELQTKVENGINNVFWFFKFLYVLLNSK